jgi:hypothetical protein
MPAVGVRFCVIGTQWGGPVSGSEVVLIGETMAAVVDAVTSVGELTGKQPIVVGGLAVLARLSSAHRATIDLDIVDRQAEGRGGQLEILRESSGTSVAEPAGVMVPTRFGEVRVDVLEVNQFELENPSDDVGDRLHIGSHAWAADTASMMTISVLGPSRQELTRASTKVAEPGPVVAMKLQAIMDRGHAKAGTDLWDIVRLVLDPACRSTIRQQLKGCPPQMSRDIGQHVERWFRGQRRWSLDRLDQVANGLVTEDDLDLVGELLLSSCARSG